MAKKSSKKAVGYVRAALWQGRFSVDCSLQAQLINDHIADKKYEKIKVVGEIQQFTKHTRNPNKFLIDLLDICEKEEADFIYCDVGFYRGTNQLLNNAIHQRSNKKKGWKFIKLPQDKRLTETIRRFNKERGKARTINRVKNPPPLPKKEYKYVSPLEVWREKWGMSKTKKKNYTHLLKGDYSICDAIIEFAKEGLSNYRIAWELNDLMFRTSTGLEWTDESVRKLRDMIDGKYEQDNILTDKKGDHFVSFMAAWRSKPSIVV